MRTMFGNVCCLMRTKIENFSQDDCWIVVVVYHYYYLNPPQSLYYIFLNLVKPFGLNLSMFTCTSIRIEKFFCRETLTLLDIKGLGLLMLFYDAIILKAVFCKRGNLKIYCLYCHRFEHVSSSRVVKGTNNFGIESLNYRDVCFQQTLQAKP